MPEFGSALRSHWLLDPAVSYLNHGTVGAPPRQVLEVQQAIRDEIERQPARFLLRELADVDAVGMDPPARLRVAAGAIAPFFGVAADDLVFVDNATTGVNAVLRSLPFRPGQEIVLTGLGYGAVARTAAYVASRTGATVRTIAMPGPGAPVDSFVDAIAAGLGPQTDVLVVDHVSAETALVLPVAAIAAECHARGVRVLVDGAHAPGAIALDIAALGVDWYVGNLHKWAWTPRSSAILWADPAHQADLHPTVISWGYGNGFAAEFDLLGTRDPSAHLSAPAAIELMQSWGFADICAHNHDLAMWTGNYLAERWGREFLTPDPMIGTMVNVALPASAGATLADAKRWKDSLLFEHGIEVPVFGDGDRLTMRVSTQVYVDRSEIERLADVVTP